MEIMLDIMRGCMGGDSVNYIKKNDVEAKSFYSFVLSSVSMMIIIHYWCEFIILKKLFECNGMDPIGLSFEDYLIICRKRRYVEI